MGIIGTALDSVSVHHGLGHHSFYLDLAGIINATKYNMIAIPFNLLSSAFAKTSICFFLLHVNQSKKRARFLYGMVGTMLMFTLAASILVFAQCSPVYALWTPSLSATNCLPAHINSTFGLAQSSTYQILSVSQYQLTRDSFYVHRRHHICFIPVDISRTYTPSSFSLSG